jgi:hypothetical protein
MDDQGAVVVAVGGDDLQDTALVDALGELLGVWTGVDADVRADRQRGGIDVQQLGCFGDGVAHLASPR